MHPNMNILCFRGKYRYIFDLQDDVDLINHMYDYENIVKAGASLSRNSNCTGRPNIYGHMLLDLQY
jgi:hypothetical protein